MPRFFLGREAQEGLVVGAIWRVREVGVLGVGIGKLVGEVSFFGGKGDVV